jgi:hypothetical protein
VVAAAFDPSDAELMLRLARVDHSGLVPLVAPVVSEGVVLSEVLLRVGVRAQAPLSVEDVARFGALDVRVSRPLGTLFLAIERAWDVTDVAIAGLSQDEITELYALRKAGLEGSPRGLELVAQVDQEALLAAAIMLALTENSSVFDRSGLSSNPDA